MPWVLIAILVAHGVLSLVFAFVNPPERIRSWFPVPAIFVFLPDRLIVPVGRSFVGLIVLGLAGFIVKTFLAAGQ